MTKEKMPTALLFIITLITVLSCSHKTTKDLTLVFYLDTAVERVDLQPNDITQVRVRDDGKVYTVEITVGERYHKMLEETTAANLGKKMAIKANAEVVYEGTILAPLQGGYLGLACTSKDQAEAIIQKMGRQAVYYSTQPTPEELENAKAYTEFAKDPWLHKAVNADLNGQWEKAEEYARKAIESSPNKPAPHELLSAIYHRQGKKELALQEALTAERLSSNDDLKKFPGTYLSLADLYSELKEYDKAIEYYKKVLSTHEGYLLAHEGLATVYEKVCMTDSAVKQYQILLESQEEHFHKQGLEGLERLKKTPCLKTQ